MVTGENTETGIIGKEVPIGEIVNPVPIGEIVNPVPIGEIEKEAPTEKTETEMISEQIINKIRITEITNKTIDIKIIITTTSTEITEKKGAEKEVQIDSDQNLMRDKSLHTRIHKQIKDKEKKTENAGILQKQEHADLEKIADSHIAND